MHTVLKSFLIASFATNLVLAQSNCKAVTFTVNGSAQNRNLNGIPVDSLESLRTFFANAPLVNVTGPQTLAGTYCTPTKKNINNSKLQVLFGSIIADRGSWQALGGTGTDFPAYNPNKYSWTQYANAQGYATLAMDRLGNGKSSHPDPIVVVQAPYEQALYVDLAKQLRSGSYTVPSYKYLIWVGNSYGSQLGTAVAGGYPTAYNEFILTGFTNTVQKGFVGTSLVVPAPAAVVDPARFGTLPPGYVTSSSEVGRTNTFFGSKAQVSFEDTVAHLFFVRKDVVSIGQFVSVYAGQFDGTGFKGRVLDLTGEQDQPFCGPGSPLLGPATCGPQLQQTGVLFPNAKYNWKSVDKTGHGIQLHNSAQTVFAVAHRFLAGESFAGGPPA